MSQIKNFFTGQVQFWVADLPVAGLNRLRQFHVRQIKNENGVVSFTAPLIHANTIKKLINNFDWQMSENHNLWRGVNFLINHFVLCVAIIVSFIAYGILDCLVYNVQINGPESILNAEVAQYLQGQGVKKFMWKNQVGQKDLALELVSNFPDIAHANVRLAGNNLVVTLATAVNQPAKVKTNIYAKYDAIVRDVIAYSGTVFVVAGDVVHAGDLLVEGAYADSVSIIGEVTYLRDDETVRLNISII